MVYDANKKKLLSSYLVSEGNASFVLDWNQTDPSMIAVGSLANQAVVLKVDKNGKTSLFKKYQHEVAVYGVSWRRSTLATGSLDGKIRLYNTQTDDLAPFEEF